MTPTLCRLRQANLYESEPAWSTEQRLSRMYKETLFWKTDKRNQLEEEWYGLDHGS